MNGSVIPNTPIAVDFWKVRQCPQARVFLLTHLHGDHIAGLTSSWSYPIYCSEVTGKLLELRHGIRKELIHTLQIGCAEIVYLDSEQSEQMSLTALDANHCPGAVMFLMEGYFGTILHTGDFRFEPEMIEKKPLSDFSGKIDQLYLDNTYCSPGCRFPSRSEATKKIIDIIEAHPTHEVIIGMRKLGKEILLCALAEHFREFISVSSQMFATLQILEAPDMFVQDSPGCRLRVVPFHTVSNKLVANLNGVHPTIVILPTSLYCGIDARPYENQEKVFVVPYSDHSSFAELEAFVSFLKPGKIIPVVKGSSRGPFGLSIADRANMQVFQKHMNDNSCQRLEIPRSVQKYMLGGGNKTLPHVKRKRLACKPIPAKRAKRGVVYNSPSHSLEVEERNTSTSVLLSISSALKGRTNGQENRSGKGFDVSGQSRTCVRKILDKSPASKTASPQNRGNKNVQKTCSNTQAGSKYKSVNRKTPKKNECLEGKLDETIGQPNHASSPLVPSGGKLTISEKVHNWLKTIDTSFSLSEMASTNTPVIASSPAEQVNTEEKIEQDSAFFGRKKEKENIGISGRKQDLENSDISGRKKETENSDISGRKKKIENSDLSSKKKEIEKETSAISGRKKEIEICAFSVKKKETENEQEACETSSECFVVQASQGFQISFDVDDKTDQEAGAGSCSNINDITDDTVQMLTDDDSQGTNCEIPSIAGDSETGQKEQENSVCQKEEENLADIDAEVEMLRRHLENKIKQLRDLKQRSQDNDDAAVNILGGIHVVEDQDLKRTRTNVEENNTHLNPISVKRKARKSNETVGFQVDLSRQIESIDTGVDVQKDQSTDTQQRSTSKHVPEGGTQNSFSTLKFRPLTVDARVNRADFRDVLPLSGETEDGTRIRTCTVKLRPVTVDTSVSRADIRDVRPTLGETEDDSQIRTCTVKLRPETVDGSASKADIRDVMPDISDTCSTSTDINSEPEQEEQLKLRPVTVDGDARRADIGDVMLDISDTCSTPTDINSEPEGEEQLKLRPITADASVSIEEFRDVRHTARKPEEEEQLNLRPVTVDGSARGADIRDVMPDISDICSTPTDINSEPEQEEQSQSLLVDCPKIATKTTVVKKTLSRASLDNVLEGTRTKFSHTHTNDGSNSLENKRTKMSHTHTNDSKVTRTSHKQVILSRYFKNTVKNHEQDLGSTDISAYFQGSHLREAMSDRQETDIIEIDSCSDSSKSGSVLEDTEGNKREIRKDSVASDISSQKSKLSSVCFMGTENNITHEDLGTENSDCCIDSLEDESESEKPGKSLGQQYIESFEKAFSQRSRYLSDRETVPSETDDSDDECTENDRVLDFRTNNFAVKDRHAASHQYLVFKFLN